MRSALKIGIKVATFGALDAGDIEGTIADEVETVFDKHIGELITKHDVVKSDMVAFKEALESLPTLFSPDVQSGEQVKPIVVIIDELDRCRPSYALQLLERMKHFFSVPKVHFVLGVNLDQLANSVVATYGPGIDGRLYLQKFIQLSIQLHDRFEHDEITTSSKFLAHLIVQSDLKGKNLEFVTECKEELQKISNHANFDLRTLEQIYGHIIRVAATVPENHFRNAQIIVGLSILKVKYPKLFLKAKDKSLEYSEVLTAFALLDSNDPKYNSRGSGYEMRLSDQSWFENWWRYVSDKDCSESFIEQMRKTVRHNFRTRFDFLQVCANNQIDKFSSA